MKKKRSSISAERGKIPGWENEKAIYKRKWKNRRKVRGEGLQTSRGRISITKFVFRFSSRENELLGEERRKGLWRKLLLKWRKFLLKWNALWRNINFMQVILAYNKASRKRSANASGACSWTAMGIPLVNSIKQGVPTLMPNILTVHKSANYTVGQH